MTTQSPEPSVCDTLVYRIAGVSDLSAIQQCERAYHPNPKSTMWWHRRLVIDDSSPNANSLVHIAEQFGNVMGYIVTTWATEQAIRIDRMMIALPFRRSKVGTRLLIRAMVDSPPYVTKMICMVPEEQLDLQLFLRACGFTALVPLREHAFRHTESGIGIKFERKYDDGI